MAEVKKYKRPDDNHVNYRKDSFESGLCLKQMQPQNCYYGK